MRSINVRSRFDGEDELQVGTFLWGLGVNGMDARWNREGTDTNNPRDFGRAVFDSNFNPYSTNSAAACD